jgi:hypothetical protein
MQVPQHNGHSSRLTDEILSALIAAAQEAVLCERFAGVPAIAPICGDLVVATEGCPRVDGCFDPDMIGWFIAHGEVPLLGDESAPREVWDIKPLSGQTGIAKWREQWHKGKITMQEYTWWSAVPYLRWEGATFVRVTSSFDRLIRAMLGKP